MAPHTCQKCSTCCLDGKDEKIPECVNQGMNKHCSARPDKNCDEDPSKGRGLPTTTIISIVLSGLAAVVIVMILAYMVYYKRKRNGQQSRQPEVPAGEQRNGSMCKLCHNFMHVALSKHNNCDLLWENGH